MKTKGIFTTKKTPFYQPQWVDVLSSLIKGTISWDSATGKFKYIDESNVSHEVPSTDSNGSLIAPTEGIKLVDNVVQYTKLTTLTATEIVGTAAGDIGHADGAVLVASPGAGYALQFINAVLIYSYAGAAYQGGAGDDLLIRVGTVSASPAIATADLITKAGDTVINLSSLSANDYIMGVNSTINLNATEITNAGGATGVIRAYITYNKITTGL